MTVIEAPPEPSIADLVTELFEIAEQLPNPPEVVKEDPFDPHPWGANSKRRVHSKIRKHRKLTVRDDFDKDGDLIYYVHMETHDRRILDDLAQRYHLELVFVNEYNDYERENFGWQPTEDDA